MARAATTSDAFNAVAEPRRRDILNYLAMQEKSVNEIVDAIEMEQPSVSKHLKVLKDVGLVEVRRDGRQMLYKVNAMAKDESEAARFRELFKTEGAESVDAAREEWWVGLRSAEEEHYSSHSRNFSSDEKFYRLGFEAALHARTRCKEYDQVLAEMDSKIEDIDREYPGMNAGEPFRKGYERGRDYYQQLCNESKAA